MATRIWQGDGQAIAQVTTCVFGGVAADLKFTLTINSKSITVSAAGTSEVTLVSAMAAAIQDAMTTTPEWAEITPTATADNAGNFTVLTLTGPADGRPFTVSKTEGAATTFSIEVREIVKGVAAKNAKYTWEIPSFIDGGTYTITILEVASGVIAYNASAATVDTAIEAISTLTGSTDVTVSLSGTTYTLEFSGGDYVTTDMGEITIDGTLLTNSSDYDFTITEVTKGGVTEEIWTLTRADSSDTEDNFALDMTTARGSGVSAPIPAGSTGNQIQLILERASFWESQDVSVTGDAGGPWRFTWVGADTDTDLADPPDPITVAAYYVGGTAVGTVGTYLTAEKVQNGGVTVAEVQRIEIDGAPITGGFQLTHGPLTTSYSAASISAANLESTLENLASITSVTVTKPAAGVWLVQFNDAIDEPLMTGSDYDLVGATVYVTQIQVAAAAIDEVQEVEVTGSPGGGTFTLTTSAETTGTIVYNATAAVVQAALEALSTPVAGDFEVDGEDGGPWLVTFQANLGGIDQDPITFNAGSLVGDSVTHTMTLTETIAATSPNHANLAANWSGSTVPVNSDTVIFEKSMVDMLYSLDQLSGVTLTQMTIRASYTGRIGLPEHNGEYYEYRPIYFQVGATTLTIGKGEGSGSSRIKINTGSVQTSVQIVGSGRAEDEGEHAIEWIGTHSSNVVRITKGDLGIGTISNAAATIATLEIGYQDSPDSDSNVEIGSNVTLATIKKTGGLLVSNSGLTTITQTSGESQLDGAITTIHALGGTVFYVGTGTIAKINAASNVTDPVSINFNRDTRGRTVTNLDIYAGASIIDHLATVTFSNAPAIIFSGFEGVTLELGIGITFTRTKT